MNLQEPYAFQMAQFMPVLRMMLRGVRCDQSRKDALAMELLEAIGERERWVEDVVGRPLNVRSPKQMMDFFYDELGLPVQKVRKTGRPTANDEALHKLAVKEPLISPIVQYISEMRSLGVFLSTFVKAPLGEDKRLRSSYNIAGTETYRWSSSKDAFGTGLNLQNIPKGTEK
jgi:DNA polymerase-1